MEKTLKNTHRDYYCTDKFIIKWVKRIKKRKNTQIENILESEFLLVRVATHTVIQEVKKASSHADL